MHIEEQRIAEQSRWVLYHGTSTRRLKSIIRENRLRLPEIGDPEISLTPDRSAAEYFACGAVAGDLHDHPGEESAPVVLVIDGEGLIALNYDLQPFNYEEGECDWENEIACSQGIDPLSEVLIATEMVLEERWRSYREAPASSSAGSTSCRTDRALQTTSSGSC
jgi:hypothetical protein